MSFITGVGWISAQNMGRGRKNNNFKMAQGELPSISQKTGFKTSYPRFSRMDEFSKLGVSAVGLALQDAGLNEWMSKREIGIVVATVYGCLQTDLDYFETVLPEDGVFASPALFSYTLPNCFLGEAAASFGLTGPGYVVSQQNSTSLSSVEAALEDMDCTGLEIALAGICDLDCPPDFPTNANIIPGAAFMVIEKDPVISQKPYGALHLSRSREILFNKSKVSDFRSLIETCIQQIWE